MPAWENLLARPHSREHFVQLYDAGEAALASNVGFYLWEGLRRGEGAIVIVTPENRDSFEDELSRLGADLRSLVDNEQLVWLDARKTLSSLMAGGQPEWRLFESVVSEAMRQVKPAYAGAGLRAYGEMVGLLWKARQFAAAVRLEQLWNKLLEHSPFSLYCAYAIDVFGKEFQVGVLDDILCAHSHLIPTQPNGGLETALNLALDELLGAEADALRMRIKANHKPGLAVMPNAEAMLLGLRKNLPHRADEIVNLSRHHYGLLLQRGSPLGAKEF